MSITRAELEDAARRAFGEDGLLPDADRSWALMAEMGWFAMTVPEHLGGLGLGREAAAVIHAELGRTLVPGPVIAQMMALTALCAADGLPERDDLLARAMGGEVFTASLVPSPSPTSTSIAVPDADRAGHMVVIEEDAVSLVSLERAAVTPRPTWDASRRLFDVSPDKAARRLVLAEGAAARALGARLQSQLFMAVAADSLGGAAAILEQTIEYLKVRRQFDRPLAMFQALKHRCADLQTRIMAARALLWSCAAEAGEDAIRAGALKAHAARLYADVAEEAIQLHGGIGLTEEHHSHLFLKRAMLNLSLGGSTDQLEEAAGRQALREGFA